MPRPPAVMAFVNVVPCMSPPSEFCVDNETVKT